MLEENIRKLKTTLSKNGHRITSARLALFETFFGAGPLSIREILEKTNNRVDRVSIYRNIELFESLDIIHRISIGWKYKLELSDAFVSHHHHLSCVGCGKIIDINEEAQLAEFIAKTTEHFGFKPLHHQFDITGYCADCQHATTG